jgi:hypothetical protein
MWVTKLMIAQVKKRIFCPIYPSQRQNLLPTLEILIQNFENFQIFKILEKNSKIQNFFLEISKTTEGPPMSANVFSRPVGAGLVAPPSLLPHLHVEPNF